MWPPHASPTSNATSSATPNAAMRPFPALSTFWPSSKPAPSMQPFETEPAILPDLVTAIFEPMGLGLEPHVSTTVARAISSPASVQSRSSERISRITEPLYPCRAPVEARQQVAEIVQGIDVVRRQK